MEPEQDNNTQLLNNMYFKASDFVQQIPLLKQEKQTKELTVCVALPTLNEEETIEDILIQIRGLVQQGLIDEFFVIDGGSSDDTVKICARNGVAVHTSQDAPTPYDGHRGKGIQLWKSLILSKSDIICWVDTDIREFSIKYILGLIAPLILYNSINFTKGFYCRPLYKNGCRVSDNGGGRVTELCARPLFNLLHPPLTHVIQPLSGEYALRRHVAESLRFANGFGVETILLIDFYKRYGMKSLAQIDMDERIHRNKELPELTKTSFVICQVLMHELGEKTTDTSGIMHVPENKHLNGHSRKIENRFTSYELKEIILPSVRDMKLQEAEQKCEIFFVRHGQTDWNVSHRIQGHTQTKLNETGKTQVTKLMLRLREHGVVFQQIYCSDLVRCMESCHILCDGLGLSGVQLRKGLRERDFGEWAGKSHADLRMEKECLGDDFSFSWCNIANLIIPGAETLDEFQNRTVQMMKEICGTPGKTLVVTSNGFLQAFYRYTQHVALSSEVPGLVLKNSSCYKFTTLVNDPSLHSWQLNQSQY